MKVNYFVETDKSDIDLGKGENSKGNEGNVYIAVTFSLLC